MDPVITEQVSREHPAMTVSATDAPALFAALTCTNQTS